MDSALSTHAASIAPDDVAASWPDFETDPSKRTSEAIDDDVPDQAGIRKVSPGEDQEPTLRSVAQNASDGGESLCPAYSESANRAGLLPPLAMRPLTWDPIRHLGVPGTLVEFLDVLAR